MYKFFAKCLINDIFYSFILEKLAHYQQSFIFFTEFTFITAINFETQHTGSSIYLTVGQNIIYLEHRIVTKKVCGYQLRKKVCCYFLLFYFPQKISVPSKIITCNFDKWNKLFIYGLSLEAGNLFRGQSLMMTHSSVYILNSQSRTRSQSHFLSIQNLTNTLPDSEFKLFKLEDMGRCRYSNKYVLLV